MIEHDALHSCRQHGADFRATCTKSCTELAACKGYDWGPGSGSNGKLSTGLCNYKVDMEGSATEAKLSPDASDQLANDLPEAVSKLLILHVTMYSSYNRENVSKRPADVVTGGSY